MTREEFAIALRHGHGRAFQYVRDQGLAPVADLVLAACVEDQAYDRQCESSRAEWLFTMFNRTEQRAHFEEQILRSLETTTDSYDLSQLCELAALLANDGTDQAATRLRSRVLNQPSTEWPWGFDALAQVDGVDAAIHFARRLGQLLQADSSVDVATLSATFENEALVSRAIDRLNELAPGDERIAMYLKYQREASERLAAAARVSSDQRASESRNRIRAERSLGEVIDSARKGIGKNPGNYLGFGRAATEEELRHVLRELTTEPDEEAIMRLLWIFRSASMPKLEPRVVELTRSKHDGVREAAIVALAQVKDSEIGELARSRIATPGELEKGPEIIKLFELNYRTGDEVLVLGALQRLAPTDESAHRIGMSLLKLIRANSDATFDGFLEWIYWYTPCTMCRQDAVETMVGRGNVSSELLIQAAADADQGTRTIAENALIARSP